MYYPGNKNIPGLIHKIINQIPPCKNFVEPFAGSASVSTFLSLLPGLHLKFFLNDIDVSITDRFNYPSGSKVTNLDFIDFLEKLPVFGSPTDTFIFMDPPYLHSTRSNNNKLYGTEMSLDDHIKFLKAARTLKNNCMIIHPATNLYNHYLKSFRIFRLTVRYHNKTSYENLYMNYPNTGQLLTYVLIGKDCWDRQRIKRKGERLLHKLSSLPAAELNYILDKIKTQFFKF